MKISRKLLLGFSIVICLSVAVGVMGIVGMENLHQSGLSMYDAQVVGMDNLRTATNYMNQSIIDLRTAAFMSFYNDMQGTLAAIEQFEANAAGFQTALSAAITIEELDVLYQPVVAEFRDNFLQSSRRIMELSYGNIPDHARTLDVNVLMAVNTESAGRLGRLLDSLAAAHSAIAEYTVAFNEQQRNLFTAMQVAFIAAAIVIGAALSVLITRNIVKPLGIVSEWMQLTAKRGDIVYKEEEKVIIDLYKDRRDEVGILFGSYLNIVDFMNDVCDELKKVADGNLDVEVTVRSEYDLLSQTLGKLVNDLNGMFGKINAATTQVAYGSKQIADGSQTLAQGSTEQAASVQKLSTSVHDVAQKTKDNADMAERASVLADTIKGRAEMGSRQMDGMMVAVGEITRSSQSIGKVIKTIDDIAFQTNILALNAAVEAARAGQHGKGFAVVAEEVRNLAAKSAEAAKDTESLISDSIKKAEFGSKIADDTAASLTEIVAGISESSLLVSEIARSSEKQSESIAHINMDIEQVAQVTQQNSATSEQSAAASQEMSSQSVMLEALVSQFRLKGELRTPMENLNDERKLLH